MGTTIPSPNMGLPVPVVGQDLGPQWATDNNSCLGAIDSHNHSTGQGVAINPAGMNINSDLTFGGNNATGFRSLRLSVQPSALSLATDLGCLYVSGVDLYYNDESGNQVRITSGGTVNATSSGISSGTATASFVAGVLVVNAASTTPANVQCASILLGNNSAGTNYATLSPPSALGSNYSLVLPTIPAVKSIMALDASGNMSAPYTVDNSTIVISSNVIEVPTGGIDVAQLSSAVLALISGTAPSGVISAYGGTSAPTGFLMCDGTSYLQASYPSLFAVIGTAYGSADGSHFNVPDLRGLFPRGVDGTAGNDPDKTTRTAQNTGGNTGNNVGSLQSDQYKSHRHSITGKDTLNGNLNQMYAPYNGGASTSVTNGTDLSGGNETRPKNLYVNYIIKT